MSQMPSVWWMDVIWHRVTHFFQSIFWQISGFRKCGTSNENKYNFILKDLLLGTETPGTIDSSKIHYFFKV
jgi:hypothetical protein